MNLPAHVTTWSEVRAGNKVLIDRRSVIITTPWVTRIDTILEVEHIGNGEMLTITALKPPDKGHKRSKQVKYVVNRTMLVAVIDSDEKPKSRKD